MRSTERTTQRRLAAGFIALALLAAACGSDAATGDTATGDTATGDTAPAEPVPSDVESPAATVAAAESVPVADEATAPIPQRIVSLSPTHTEMLFAIGAGDQLVAVDEFSDYPAEALELPNELSGFEPNVEAIAAYEPDLVVIGGGFTGLGELLATLDIPSWDGPAAMTIEDTYAQLEQLGSITGHSAEAAEVVDSMAGRIADIIASTPTPPTPLTFYHELDSTLYSADSTTFIGEIYSMVGLQNIADRAEGNSFGFPQLNAEFLVSANPDLIFLADTKCCAETAETVAARPGWDAIAAVQNGNVIEMDDDLASRWGPRIVDYLEAVSAAVQRALSMAT